MALAACRGALRRVWTDTRAGFASLQGSPPDLWKVYGLKVIESYSYFSLSVAFTLYLSDNFGVSDYKAGFYYGLWGMLLTLYGFIFGGLIDWLGVRASLVLCFALHTVCRAVMAVTTSRTVLLAVLLGPEAAAGSLGVPVLTIGIKRFTTQGNRGFAFALYYAVMNVAALSVGVVLDFFRITIRAGFGIDSVAADSVLNSGLRLFVLTGAIASAAGVLVSWRLSVPATDPEPPLKSKSSDSGDGPPAETPAVAKQTVGWRRTAQSALRAAAVVGRDREFWKFLAMCVFTVNLKSIFRHLDATLPKYQIRMFGCAVPVGLVYSINPFMIIFLVPVIGALTTHANHFDMIHLGGYVSALAPFWMVAFSTEWATMLFVVFLSLGEAIWSPRWYDYSMSVAPEGREGIWTALASAPLFAAKLPTGMISGQLLQSLCPAPGACPADLTTSPAAAGTAEPASAAAPPSFPPSAAVNRAAAAAALNGPGGVAVVQACQGRPMWLFIGLITLSSPLAILLTQRWVRPAPAASRRTDSDSSLPQTWDPAADVDGDSEHGLLLPVGASQSTGGIEMVSGRTAAV